MVTCAIDTDHRQSKDVFEAFCLKWSQLNGTACNKLREYWKVGDWIGVVNILGHVTIDSGKTSRKVQVDVFLTINETTSKGNAPEMLNLIRTAVLFKYPKCTYIHYKDGREKAKKPDESKIMFLMRMKKTEVGVPVSYEIGPDTLLGLGARDWP